MGAAHALVVDDRIESRTLVVEELEEAGFRVTSAADGVEGWRAFRDHAPDLIITDLKMPRSDGLALVGRVRRDSSVPVMLLSAFADVPTAVAALKAGADEVLRFPDDLPKLVERARALVAASASGEASRLDRRVVGRSPGIRRVRERVEALAPLKVPVWVWGEPGTGRDWIVEAMHSRASHAPQAQLERVRPGDATHRDAEHVALYLDDLDAFPMEAQQYWAGAWVAERELPVRAAKGSGPAPRIFVSSVEDPAVLLTERRIHPGFADLARFSIRLPPLRQRREDIAPLVNALVGKIGPSLGRQRSRVAPGAVTRLRAQNWPGNVRELATVLEKALAFSQTGVVRAAQVDAVLRENPQSVASLRRRHQLAQRRELVALLDECGGNLAEVARRLELSRGAVIYRARRFGLLDPPTRSQES